MNNPALCMHVSQRNQLKFVAKTSTGIAIIAEPTPMLGGSGTYPNPLEYFIASLGMCAAIKVQIDLAKMDNPPESIAVMIEYSRKPTPPEVLEDIHLTFTLTGNLDNQNVTGAIHEVMTCYCPVAVMVSSAAHVTWEHRIL